SRRTHEFHRSNVVLLLSVIVAEDGVVYVAIAGQQDQPFRVLVQPPAREDPLRVVHEVHDVVLHRRFGGAGDADRLVECDIDVAAAARDDALLQRLAVQQHDITLAHFGADAGTLAVHGDAAFADQPGRLAPGTMAGVADVTVEP